MSNRNSRGSREALSWLEYVLILILIVIIVVILIQLFGPFISKEAARLCVQYQLPCGGP